MAGGLLWCNHSFHRAFSRRDAHPVPCELHSFAEYGITLVWIHACRGSSHGESIWVFPNTKCCLERVGSLFWKSPAKGVHFHSLSQFRSWQALNLWQVQRGTNPAFLSPHLQLSHAFAYCHVKYLQRSSFKRRTLKKYRPRSELVAELGHCTQPYSWAWAGPLQSASYKLPCSEQQCHNLQTGDLKSHRRCGSFWQQSCKFLVLQSSGIWVVRL